MKWWKEVLVDYLSFSVKERLGALFILLVISLSILLPMVFSKTGAAGVQEADSAWMAAIAQLERQSPPDDRKNNRKEDNNEYYQYDRRASNPGQPQQPTKLFFFDPNTITGETWKKLGLSQRTIQTILNYRAKGGQFRKPEELARIYGLRREDYDRIAPYIRIKYKEEKKPDEYVKPAYSSKSKNSYEPIDINIADTAAFINLPGIGSKLASRIILFRGKLGGFHAIEQVSETYGLPDSTYQKIRAYLKIGNTAVRKININTANLDDMKGHPYIRYKLAQAILAYRNEHGPFQKIDDLKKLMALSDDQLKKLSPYLIVGE